MKILAFLLILALISCEKKQTSAWQTLDFGAFKLEAPQGWEIIEMKGIDSYVGRMTNRKDTLDFDYGWYSPSVDDEEPAKHKLAIDTVNGLLAHIIIPITDGHGEIAMSISQFKDEQDKFIIRGNNISGVDTILRIFKSIRFPESVTTKNPPLTSDKFQINLAGTGRQLFRNNCVACHAMDVWVVGPPLKDMQSKHPFEWTFNFLANRKLLKADTTFIHLTKGRDVHCLEFPTMTKQELQLIIDNLN